MASVFSVNQDVKFSGKGGGGYMGEDEKKALKYPYMKMGDLSRSMLPTLQSHKHVTLKLFKVETILKMRYIYNSCQTFSLCGFILNVHIQLFEYLPLITNILFS